MNTMPVVRRQTISKQMAKAIRRAEAEIEKEGSRQLDIQVCSASLALWRYWGWKRDRLSSLLRIQQEIWNEVGQDNDISMLQLLDQECDIELTNCEGVSYKEYKFLNTAIDDGHKLSAQEWIIMRQKQKKWIECQIMACVFLGMHRKEGWGAKRVKDNKVWIDGKPIYRKVVDFGMLANSASKSVAHIIYKEKHVGCESESVA